MDCNCKINVIENIIENCESGLLLISKDNERLFFEDDYNELKDLVKEATSITYNSNDKINDYKIKKVYFTLPKYGQVSLEVI